MNIRFDIKFFERDLHLLLQYRFFKFRKEFKYKDLTGNNSKKKQIKVIRNKKKRIKNKILNLKELLNTMNELRNIGQIKWMRISENGIIDSKLYFFYYSFIFLFFNNVFIFKKSQEPLININGVYKLNLRKGGVVLWKKLRKYLKS